MKRKKIAKPMNIITQNYWGTKQTHIVPRWLDNNVKIINPKPITFGLKREYHDTDYDGVPNFQDCNIWNPHEQGLMHTAGKVYEKLRRQKLERKQRILKEDAKDRKEPFYTPAGMRRVGSRIYSGIKSTQNIYPYQNIQRDLQKAKYRVTGSKTYQAGQRVGGFAKGVYQEAQRMNPDYGKDQSVVGYYRVQLYQPVVDEYGRTVGEKWVDVGAYEDPRVVEQIVYQISQRGGVYRVIPPKTTRTDMWKRNVQQGMQIKKKPSIPVAHVMVHSPQGMRGTGGERY